MKKTVLTFLVSSLAIAATVTAAPLNPETALKNAFPGLKADSIVKTDIPGIYEVISGQNVLYFSPDREYIIAGEIFTKDGRNLTQERKQGMMALKLKELPLDKAVKVGDGKTVIVEFTDPDCPYCRRASKGFKELKGVTRYVFLTPIAHPNALPKVHYILHSDDPAKALEEMMEGKEPPRAASDYPDEVKKRAQEHMAWGRKVGVSGTPTFFINGQVVVGADMERIRELVRQSEEMRK